MVKAVCSTSPSLANLTPSQEWLSQRKGRVRMGMDHFKQLSQTLVGLYCTTPSSRHDSGITCVRGVGLLSRAIVIQSVIIELLILSL